MLKAGKITSILGIVFGAIYVVYYVIAITILGSAMACYDGMAGCVRDNECAGKETILFVAQMAVDSIISEPCGQCNLAEYALNTIH